MTTHGINRRRFLATAAATVAAPYVRTSRAAGSLSVGFWDHWVPGANDVLAKLCREWAAKEKVDLKIDFITSLGSKLLLTITSEAQTKSGHDVLSFGQWLAAGVAEPAERSGVAHQSANRRSGRRCAARADQEFTHDEPPTVLEQWQF